MWMVIHMTKSETAANDAKDCLAQEGFMVKLRPVYRAVSAQDNYFELLALRSEAEEARQLLVERGLC